MSLVVEDGSGLANSESYASVATLQAYADARGLTYGSNTALIEQALRRSTAYINTYRGRFSGYRTFRRAQALEWPRIGAFYYLADNGRSSAFYFGDQADYNIFYDQGYDIILSNVVPVEVVQATCEAAIREIATPGYLLPDDAGQGILKMQKAGDTAQEYFAPQLPFGPKIPAIALLLAPLLLAGSGNGIFGIASRA